MEHTEERIEEWMERQEVSSIESFCGCCDPQLVKRRRARYVLYKQLVLEEIEKCCQKYEDKLLPEEKEAIEEVKEKFSRGNYSNIQAMQHIVGTFYHPVSLLSLIYPRALLYILFPRAYTIYHIIGVLTLKDQQSVTHTGMIIRLVCCLFMFPFIDILHFLFMIPLFFIFLSLMELTMLAASIIFCYGFYFLSRYGVTNYPLKICLVREFDDEPDNICHTIRHAPF